MTMEHQPFEDLRYLLLKVMIVRCQTRFREFISANALAWWELPVDVSAYQKEGPIRKASAESLLKDIYV